MVFISFPGSSGIMFPVVVCTFVMSCKVIPADFVVVNVVVLVLSVVVVTVADVDAEDSVGNSLLQIWELRFGHKAVNLFIL